MEHSVHVCKTGDWFGSSSAKGTWGPGRPGSLDSVCPHSDKGYMEEKRSIPLCPGLVGLNLEQSCPVLSLCCVRHKPERIQQRVTKTFKKLEEGTLRDWLPRNLGQWCPDWYLWKAGQHRHNNAGAGVSWYRRYLISLVLKYSPYSDPSCFVVCYISALCLLPTFLIAVSFF